MTIAVVTFEFVLRVTVLIIFSFVYGMETMSQTDRELDSTLGYLFQGIWQVKLLR